MEPPIHVQHLPGRVIGQPVGDGAHGQDEGGEISVCVPQESEILRSIPGDRMDTVVVIHPDLEIPAAEFCAAWNEIPECRAAAEAQVRAGAPTQYMEPATLGTVLVAGATWAASHLVWDLVKHGVERALAKRARETADLVVTEITKPDGTRILTVSKRAR
jgi:hypothetical protein